MANLDFAGRVAEDFRRIRNHLREYEVENAPQRFAEIIEALDILTFSPFIGRPWGKGLRELVIGRGSHGYCALYRYSPLDDLVTVLAIKSQSEVGYRH